MTKKEAEREFRREILPLVREQYEKDHRIDRPARDQAWNDWTDGLCEDGRITRKQCDRWAAPEW